MGEEVLNRSQNLFHSQAVEAAISEIEEDSCLQAIRPSNLHLEQLLIDLSLQHSTSVLVLRV